MVISKKGLEKTPTKVFNFLTFMICVFFCYVHTLEVALIEYSFTQIVQIKLRVKHNIV